jgi:hypothetical protein
MAKSPAKVKRRIVPMAIAPDVSITDNKVFQAPIRLSEKDEYALLERQFKLLGAGLVQKVQMTTAKSSDFKDRVQYLIKHGYADMTVKKLKAATAIEQKIQPYGGMAGPGLALKAYPKHMNPAIEKIIKRAKQNEGKAEKVIKFGKKSKKLSKSAKAGVWSRICDKLSVETLHKISANIDIDTKRITSKTALCAILADNITTHELKKFQKALEKSKKAKKPSSKKAKKTPKTCKSGKVLYEKSGNCVIPCKPDYIRNPLTSRCVNKTSRRGKKVLKIVRKTDVN